jgi:hypothetical protein
MPADKRNSSLFDEDLKDFQLVGIEPDLSAGQAFFHR